MAIEGAVCVRAYTVFYLLKGLNPELTIDLGYCGVNWLVFYLSGSDSDLSIEGSWIDR